jgi:hypothetical protein
MDSKQQEEDQKKMQVEVLKMLIVSVKELEPNRLFQFYSGVSLLYESLREKSETSVVLLYAEPDMESSTQSYGMALGFNISENEASALIQSFGSSIGKQMTKPENCTTH